MKLNILAFGAHPDDVEMSAGGTLVKHIELGYTCGIIDLTQGEMGTRGNIETRKEEAANAAKILGVSVRENLKMRDGFFRNDEEHQMLVIEMLRKYQPDIVFANAISDRHPDHAKAADLLRVSCFLSGLAKVSTFIEGKKQEAWRPRAVYHYIQDERLKPDLLIDISSAIEKKMDSIRAYKTQFHNPESKEPETYISKPTFLDALKGRLLEWGKTIGVDYAEGFTVNKIVGVKDLMELK